RDRRALHYFPTRRSSDLVGSEKDDEMDDEVVTPADRIDASRILTMVLGLALVIYLIVHFAQGGTLTLDVVNWSFLALILLLMRRDRKSTRLNSSHVKISY